MLQIGPQQTSSFAWQLSAFWEQGSPDLPACGLRRGLKGAQHGPSSSTQDPRPSRGAKPRVGTPILSHIDPACNTSYHFAASRTVLPRVPPYLARDRLRLLAHVYDSVASIHMTENPGRHG